MSASAPSRGRLSRQTWADAALAALARSGPRAVAVEPLARRLGVTKGSFYWHFKGRDELLAAAMERWEQLTTAAVITEAGEAPPRQRLRALFEQAFEVRRMGFLLVHLAANAADPIIGPALERVTTRRLTFLARIYEDCGLQGDEARHRALLAYSAYIGLFHVLTGASGLVADDRSTYIEHLVETLVP